MHAALLSEFSTTGISPEGAKAQKVLPGPPGSHRLALIDLPRLLHFKAEFEHAAKVANVPSALLAAICSRETHGRNVVGDGGNGIGLMQIDKRYHTFASTKEAMVPEENIKYGALLLREYWNAMCSQKDKVCWTYAETLRGAVCAYNSGVKNVRTWDKMDQGTTQNDYSADVWERARALLPHFKE